MLAPLVTWLPMLAHQYPRLGLPKYDLARGIDIWHLQTFWLVAFLLVAVMVGHRDRWLGAGVLVLGIGVFFWGGTFDITHRIVTLLGILALWAMRHLPYEFRPMVTALLAASGIFQAVYVLQQHLGFDLLWSWSVGGQFALRPNLQPLGTLGTVDATSAYIAITAPLMPIWAVPLALAMVLKSHSIGAITACFVGLLVRYHRDWRITAALSGGIVFIWWLWYMPPHVPTTVSGRLAVWWFAVQDWWATNPLFGVAPWAQRIPQLQIQQNFRPNGEVWLEAHNEYLQWLYQYGLLGFSILGLWLWEHRRMFRDASVGASLCALAVVSGSFFTFHVASVALAGICLIGLATAYGERGGVTV